VLLQLLQHGGSTVPVYRGERGNVIGCIQPAASLRQLLFATEANAPTAAECGVSSVPRCAATDKLVTVFRAFMSGSCEIAAVHDAQGNDAESVVVGILTKWDVLSFLCGHSIVREKFTERDVARMRRRAADAVNPEPMRDRHTRRQTDLLRRRQLLSKSLEATMAGTSAPTLFSPRGTRGTPTSPPSRSLAPPRRSQGAFVSIGGTDDSTAAEASVPSQ